MGKLLSYQTAKNGTKVFVSSKDRLNTLEEVILIADVEGKRCDSLQQALARAGYQSSYAAGVEEAVRMARELDPELVLLQGLSISEDVIRRLCNGTHGRSHLVMVLSSLNDAALAVEAMRAGAVDYLIEPFRIDELLKRIQQALESSGNHQPNRIESYRTNGSIEESEIVAGAEAMQLVLRLARQVANQGNSTVLIRGETGVGKDLVARYIHRNSPRRNQAMVEINCPSFPSALLESELFGHERGAFTGANASKKGLLEIAHGGTAFLNEIGEIDLDVQAKLLQFMENKVFRRVGSTRERMVDARIVAATNQPLEEAMREHRFRSDLYYRLNVVPIFIPPLRERLEDVPLLVEHFLRRLRIEFQRPALAFKPEAMNAFMRYEWPGNVRELKNCLERMALLSVDDQLGVDLLPDCMMRSTTHACYDDRLTPVSSLNEHEKRMLSNALREAKWNQSRAARKLNITRDTLRYRIKKHGIVPPSKAPNG